MKNYGTKWKERIANGETVIGGHIFLPNSSMAEAMASFGYEYIWVDGEHGPYDKESILNHIVAINGAGAGAFVRVTAGEPFLIKPVVEMGPDGIIFPMICTAEEAKRAIDACVYPPEGKRGFGPRRASRYSKIKDGEYLESIDNCLVKIVQIEHVDGVKNLDSILQIKGIDGVVIGPYDLSASLNICGQLKHPDILKCYEQIISICKKNHIPCGISTGAGDDEYLKYWIDHKVNFLFYGDDIGFIKKGVEETLIKIKNGLVAK